MVLGIILWFCSQNSRILGDALLLLSPSLFALLSTQQANEWIWEAKCWGKENDFIRKAADPEYSLEGLMLKLKLQYSAWCEEPTHWKRPWCWERVRAGRRGVTEDERLDGITDSTDMSWIDSGKEWRTGKPAVLQFMGLQRVRHDWTIVVTYGWLLLEASFFHDIFFSHLFWSPGPGQNCPPFIILALLTMDLGFCGQVRKEQKSCRKGNPFQSPKGGSCLTLRNELSEET